MILRAVTVGIILILAVTFRAGFQTFARYSVCAVVITYGAIAVFLHRLPFNPMLYLMCTSVLRN